MTGEPKRKRQLYVEMEPRPGMTLTEVRVWLRENVEEGAKCPACTQAARVYRRTIHAAMAVNLIRFARRYGEDWGLATVLMPGGQCGDFAKLRYWDLIEESTEKRVDGGRAGWWRMRPSGIPYVNDQIRVPRYAEVFDGRCLRLTGPYRGIQDALGTRFNYNELMRRPL